MQYPGISRMKTTGIVLHNPVTILPEAKRRDLFLYNPIYLMAFKKKTTILYNKMLNCSKDT